MTKDIFKILGIMIIVLFCLTLTVYASDPQVKIVGDESVKAGETKTITINISSDSDKIGTVEGNINFSSNIENVKINPNDPDRDDEVSTYNGWTMSYNQSTGDFATFKATGTSNGAVFEFTYNISANSTDDATITISNLSLTTLNYETKNISTPVVKTIKIAQDTPDPTPTPTPDPTPTPTPDPTPEKTLDSISVTKAPNKVTYKEGEKFSKNGMEITAKYSDGSKKVVTDYTYSPTGVLKSTDKSITISYTENGTTKSTTQSITVEKANEVDEPTNDDPSNNNNKNQNQEEVNENKKQDSTTTEKNLPFTGIATGIAILAAGIAVIGIVFYKKYKYLKNI